MSGFIVFQPWFDWCTKISLCSLLVSHQWWHMLWHLRKKILSSSSYTVTGFFKLYFSVACLLAVLAADFWIHRVWIMPTCPPLNWAHWAVCFLSSLTVASPFGGGVSEAQEWHWDVFGRLGWREEVAAVWNECDSIVVQFSKEKYGVSVVNEIKRLLVYWIDLLLSANTR